MQRSKENIQPLHQGNKTTRSHQDHKLHQKCLAEQRQFEYKLKSYNGQDPLSIWYEYILWGEQNLSKSGLDSNLHSLIEKCCSSFKNNEYYKNDSRFLDVWTKLIANCSKPLDVYNFLYTNNMFVEVGKFYLNWAVELEKKGYFQKANAVYSEGTSRNAKLADTLKLHHRQFLARLNSRSHQEMQIEENSTEYSLPFPVKFSGNKIEVHQRKNDTHLEGKTTDQNVSTFQAVKKRSTFTILDESQQRQFTQSNEQNPVGFHPAARLENVKKSTTLSYNSTSHSEKKMDSGAEQFQQPNFVVHEDGQGAVPKIVTKTRPMYCKDKIYNGSREYSFEELRLVQWNKKHKQQIEIQQLLDGIFTKWKEEQQKLFNDMISQFLKSVPNPNVPSQLTSQQQVQMEKMAEVLHQSLSSNQLNALKEKATKIAEIATSVNCANAAATQPVNTKVPIQGINPVQSPTVCTKEARMAMLNLFNKTLNIYDEENKSPSGASPKLKQTIPVHEEANAKIADVADKPYVIYSDETNTFPKGLKEDANMNTCENDFKENEAPPDYVQIEEKRPLIGILQPSVDIPYGVEEQDEPMEIKNDDNFPDIMPLNLDDDFTMAPPRNSLAFAENARIISTPVVGFNKTPFYTNDMTFCPQKGLRDDTTSIVFKKPLMPSETVAHEETKWILPPLLGVIAETSRENATSSSSSSNPCSQTSTSMQNRANSCLLQWPEKIDPFEDSVKNKLLSCLPLSLNSRLGIVYISSRMPVVKANSTVHLGGTSYIVYSHIAKGAYAKVFSAVAQNDSDESYVDSGRDGCILKVEQTPSSWEFYITDELHRRLNRKTNSFDARPGIVHYTSAYIYNDGGILTTKYIKNGTLLDLMNLIKRHKETMFEGLIIYFTIELLQLIHQMHQSQIIHADIKPDNILVVSMPELNLYTKSYTEMFPVAANSLLFIDFGRSIDMSLLPPKTTFTRVVETEDHICPEMLDGRPWTYQIDTFGLVSVVHCMLFDSYVKISKVNGTWKINNHLKRYWQCDLWQDFFHEFLNIPDCNQQPDLMKWCQRFQETFVKAKLHSNFGFNCSRFERLLENK